MKYVLAEKPPRHNGGVFYEHEVHFEVTDNRVYRTAELKQAIEDFLVERIGTKHDDFRISLETVWWYQSGKVNTSPNRMVRIKARFVDKNKALMFKLSWPN